MIYFGKYTHNMCMALTSSDLELRLSCISFHMGELLIRHAPVV